MKVALITGGQPRFTPDFINVLNQLQGFNSADIYMCLWSSDWANNSEQARSKIEKILPSRYTLAKVQVVNPPDYILPPHKLHHPPEEPENIRWFYKRRHGQLIALTMTYDLVDQKYDAMVRFRLDGRLGGPLDISKLDISNDVIVPNNSLAGHDTAKLNDQFAVASQENMKFYCGAGREFPGIVPESDPNWENLGHGLWAVEHLLGTYFNKYRKTFRLGDFTHHINTQGRSKYTDKHYHHGIVRDPTD